MNNLNWLSSKPFAHRGLHDARQGVPENSMLAFNRAIAAGYGIELDVQVISGEEVIVFHDDDLSRMCHRKVKVTDLPLKDLHLYYLSGTRENIPKLEDVLRLVSGRVPLLIEIKRQPGIKNSNQLIANALLGYKGPMAVMSFDPLVLGWFGKYAPLIPRGQLASDFKGLPMPRFVKFLLRHMLLNFISRPQFLAYEERALPASRVSRLRNKGLPVLAWTVLNEAVRQRITPYSDNIIFEGFNP